MKASRSVFPIVLLGLLGFCACSESVFSELPKKVAMFIEQYYPQATVESYSEENGLRRVDLDKSATFVFNSDDEWVSVNGNGVPIPAEFTLDEFPETLYDYLDSTMATADVYSVSRERGLWTVVLTNQVIHYDQTSGRLSVDSPTF